MTDPTGIFFKYKATAIGEGETEILEELHKKYKEDLTVDEGIKLAIEGLKKYLDKDFTPNRIDICYVKTDTKKFVRLNHEDVSKICK